MHIIVEFFGIPRQRTGMASCELELPDHDDTAPFADILAALGQKFPRFAEDCLEVNHLRAGYIANLDGKKFLTDPALPIPAGSHLLILSADAGG